MANPSYTGKTIELLSLQTVSATSSGTVSLVPVGEGFEPWEGLILTLEATAAARTSDATYDIYVTCTDGISEWDLVHFPQIAASITSSPKTYTARLASKVLPQTVSSSGSAANDNGCLETDTAGSNQGPRTLAAGSVRHGLHAGQLNTYVVIGGTDAAPSITFNLYATAVPE